MIIIMMMMMMMMMTMTMTMTMMMMMMMMMMILVCLHCSVITFNVVYITFKGRNTSERSSLPPFAHP